MYIFATIAYGKSQFLFFCFQELFKKQIIQKNMPKVYTKHQEPRLNDSVVSVFLLMN
jgi:hypothetical protein